jgi:peptidoglycan hydrolase-like protein with peptidoglycan-binding domain
VTYFQRELPSKEQQEEWLRMQKVIPKPYPIYSPFPGQGFFRLGQKHPIIKAMSAKLIAAGYNGFSNGATDKFDRGTVKAYAWYQRKQGLSGKLADGYPTAATWKELQVPQV